MTTRYRGWSANDGSKRHEEFDDGWQGGTADTPEAEAAAVAFADTPVRTLAAYLAKHEDEHGLSALWQGMDLFRQAWEHSEGMRQRAIAEGLVKPVRCGRCALIMDRNGRGPGQPSLMLTLGCTGGTPRFRVDLATVAEHDDIIPDHVGAGGNTMVLGNSMFPFPLWLVRDEHDRPHLLTFSTSSVLEALKLLPFAGDTHQVVKAYEDGRLVIDETNN